MEFKTMTNFNNHFLITKICSKLIFVIKKIIVITIGTLAH